MAAGELPALSEILAEMVASTRRPFPCLHDRRSTRVENGHEPLRLGRVSRVWV